VPSAIHACLRRAALCALAPVALGALAALVLPARLPARSGPPRSAGDGEPRPAAVYSAQDRLSLTLPARTYVRLVVVPSPDGSVVRRTGPDGKTDQTILAPDSTDAPQHLSWVNEAAGEYRWTVAARDPRAVGGAVAIGLDEERPQGPCDATRTRAERELWSGRLDLEGNRFAAAHARFTADVPAAEQVGELPAVLGALLGQADAARQMAAGPAAAAAAEKLFARALELARALGAARDEAAALQGLAVMQPPSRIAAALGPALERERQAGDESAQVETLQWLGYELKKGSDPRGGLTAYRAALALEERRGGVAGLASIYCEIGGILGLQGDLDAARHALGISDELARQAGDLPGEARALRFSAELEINLGELQAANEDLAQARTLLAQSGASDDLASVLNDSGMVLFYLNKPKPAQQRYEEALAQSTATDDAEGIAAATLGLGEILAAAEQRDAAVARFETALELSHARGRSDLEVRALYDLGGVHRQMGQPARAVRELQSAIALEPPDHPQRQAQLSYDLGRCYEKAGRLADADTAFKQAIQLVRHSPIVAAAAWAGLARLRRDRGELSAARTAAENALDLAERVRTAVIRPDQRVSFLASLRGYFELSVDLLMRLDAREPAAGHAAEALAVSEKARARGLLDLLARERVDVSRGISPQLKQREAETAERIARLDRRLSSVADSGSPDPEVQQLAHQLAQAEDEELHVDATIVQQRPAYAALVPQRTLGLAEIQGKLDADSALLEYFLGDEASYLFVVTRQGLTSHVLAPRAKLATQVEEVRTGMAADSSRGAHRLAQGSYDLYVELLRPAAGELAGKSHLIVAPDGPLYALSFEALLTRPPPAAGAPRRELAYLIRERSVSYAPSASVLAVLLATRRDGAGGGPAGKAFVGFGDPQIPPAGFAATRGGATPPPQDGPAAMPALPGARSEVSRIAQLFPGDAAVFTGAAATESEVRTNPLVGSARYLHFAVHGSLDENEPESSGLRLAAAGPADDGLLQVREIFDLDLCANLVVLSACQTGVGQQVSGEGIIGMTRAFLYAGAQSVVVSLWQVDDQSTAELMVSFYRHLQQTGDRAAALRLAKLHLLDLGYSHPYYWAPFVLVGLAR
jgi:CHAT domain-containing protein/Tfp pilus assembly protein PilF